MTYRVKYLRTRDWYTGDWRELSTWCSENIEKGKWDYAFEHFFFVREEDQLLFLLRWGENHEHAAPKP